MLRVKMIGDWASWQQLTNPALSGNGS